MKQWLGANDIENFSRDIVSEWFQYFQKVMHRVVKRYQLESIRELATTLLFVVLSDRLNIFVQLGDGVIAIGDKGDLCCVFMPQNGEFLNTTNFATQSNATDLFMFTTIKEPVKYLAMHTDGIEQISFDFQAQKPFQPFFIPFYNALEKVDNGYSEALSRQLNAFLQSERVNKKTDDDKTLFLALTQDFPIISNLEESPDE